MKLYGAIDLHPTNNVTVVINACQVPQSCQTCLTLVTLLRGVG